MQTDIPRSEFPRPDFVREHWLSLNGPWSFSFDAAVFDRTILVPFCCQSPSSGIGETADHETVWYRRSFPVDAEQLTGSRLLLKFGAVDTQTDVWINGLYLGRHDGGYTPFSFDITQFVYTDRENELTLRARDGLAADRPRGKQTWTGQPFGCWYTPVTGIWQSVWLEYAGSAYLERVKCTPDVARLEALCELFTAGGSDVQAEISARIDGWELCRQTVFCRNGYGKVLLAFPDFDLRRKELLWTPEHPNLVQLRVTLLPAEGRPDVVDTYFGMRSIACRNMRVTLNGDPYFQRLVLDQGYWPESLLTPPSDEAIRRDIELTKAMGFNGVRKHQKIEDPRYYYWADKLGLLVWGEMPSAYLFNDNAIQSTAQMLTEFLARDYNHPCIAAWVPVNESWGVRDVQTSRRQQDYCRMLLYLIKAMDPTRPVSANDGWEQIPETDLCTIHDYALMPTSTGKYDDLRRLLEGAAEKRFLFAEGGHWQGQPVLLTEFGGIAFDRREHKDSWGYYGRVKDENEFMTRLDPVVKYLLNCGQFSGFCYTQLTDVMQEENGVLTADRRPKVPMEMLRNIFGRRII